MSDRPQPARLSPDLRRQMLVMFGNTSLVLVLLTLGYYVLPLRIVEDEPMTIARLVASVAIFATLGWVLLVHLRWSRRTLATEYFRIQWLLSGLYLLVLTFALAYTTISVRSPDQISGIGDRTDALYFSVTVISTVGFGDIHAQGAFARVVVTVQMVFNLIYLGTALRILSTLRGGTRGT